ncbi:DUF2829 domain-containing protein [Pseudooceanicola atlanticus]|uniref:DUF2829 domain-containing protein n=1 Tax=Pseudooceanicola atlanticus TaxID=1461694 RepID=UPI00235310F3|nr:DUF2829 domain-containing protein [Pseudooceanicola atlanticus]
MPNKSNDTIEVVSVEDFTSELESIPFDRRFTDRLVAKMGFPNFLRHSTPITFETENLKLGTHPRYEILSQMDFGYALAALKDGNRVARAGWNVKGMWLSMSCDGTREIPAEGFWSPHNAAHAAEQGGTATVLPSITMKTATGEILMGWLASQTDMLAEDWQIVEY